MAENERNNIRTRQAEGIRAAKKRGVKFGRPPIPIPENFEEIVRKWEEGELELVEVLEQSGLSKGTFYRRYRELCLRKQILGEAVITVDGTALRQ